MILHLVIVILFCLAVTGCGPRVVSRESGADADDAEKIDGGLKHGFTTPRGSGADSDDEEKLREADIRILFVGNSHTTSQNLPSRVCAMIGFLQPGKTARSRVVSVANLERLAGDSFGKQELEAHPWTAVVLQAQKISVSGKFDYPRDDGIAFARWAKERGTKVFFFSEWGLRDDPTNGPRHEKIYREMAEQAGVEVAAVGRAWDLALAERPDLALHDFDGNHQSHLGAFLTACVLVGRLTGEDPSALDGFPDEAIQAADRQFLARTAAKSLRSE